jgi:hypothetical protein
MPMEPDTPFYRRWSFLLAGVIGMAAVVALLGWQGFADVGSSPTTTVTPPTTTVPPTTQPPPTSLNSTSKPSAVLWEAVERRVSSFRSETFRAPEAWRITWAYDCSNFAPHGAGTFKITGSGSGAFGNIQIDKTDVRANGTETIRGGGTGRLNVETVCERWTVRALSG